MAIASTSVFPKAARTPKRQVPLFEDEDVLAILVMLHEKPYLYSSDHYRSERAARYVGEILQRALAEYGSPVRLSMYEDREGWRWIVRLKDA